MKKIKWQYLLIFVCNSYNVTPEQLLSNVRRYNVTLARGVFYLCVIRCGLNLRQVSTEMGKNPVAIQNYVKQNIKDFQIKAFHDLINIDN